MSSAWSRCRWCSRSSPPATRPGGRRGSIRWRRCAMSDATSPGMFSPFERMVALRYLRARRQGRSLSFTAMISLIGIGLGVGALIIVMSVMNGMRHDVLSHILGVDPHVRVEQPDGPLKDYNAIAQKVAGVPGVVLAMPTMD